MTTTRPTASWKLFETTLGDRTYVTTPVTAASGAELTMYEDGTWEASIVLEELRYPTLTGRSDRLTAILETEEYARLMNVAL